VVNLIVVPQRVRRVLVVLAGLSLVSVILSAVVCAGQLYDPMRPHGASAVVADQEPAAQELHLMAIVVGASQRTAVINGKNVLEGDQLDGYRVQTISTAAVLLSRAGKSKRLTLPTVGQANMQVSPLAAGKNN